MTGPASERKGRAGRCTSRRGACWRVARAPWWAAILGLALGAACRPTVDTLGKRKASEIPGKITP